MSLRSRQSSRGTRPFPNRSALQEKVLRGPKTTGPCLPTGVGVGGVPIDVVRRLVLSCQDPERNAWGMRLRSRILRCPGLETGPKRPVVGLRLAHRHRPDRAGTGAGSQRRVVFENRADSSCPSFSSSKGLLGTGAARRAPVRWHWYSKRKITACRAAHTSPGSRTCSLNSLLRRSSVVMSRPPIGLEK